MLSCKRVATTIRIVSRIELTAFLSDKGGGVLRSGLNRRNVMSATNQPATMKGPAIFLAQFVGNAQPFNSFAAICGWAAGLGYKGVQVPTSDPRLIDLDKAAVSQTYCDEITGVAASHGLVITELSTHLQGQLVAVHPAYNEAFDAFAPTAVRGKPKERQIWAVDQMKKAAQASRRSVSPAASALPARWRGPFFIPGRSGRRA